MSRFARQLALIGEEGQQRLSRSRVLLVGLGGLGCPAAQCLASAGVGTLVLCDHDRVDLSNLARQTLYRAGDVGAGKVDCAARALADLNPEVRIETHRRRVDRDALAELLDEHTLVIDGSDNFATRLAVNQACLDARRPWVMGAAIRHEGQVLVLRPDRDDQPCYRCVYGDAAHTLDDCQGAGVFTPLTGVIGHLMAAEALRIVLDQQHEVPRLSLFDARYSEWRQLDPQRRPDCPACHDRS